MITPTLENYYDPQTQQEWITNSQVGVYLKCQFRWFMQYKALEYQPLQDLPQFIIGHLFEQKLLRPNDDSVLKRYEDRIYNATTKEQVIEAFKSAEPELQLEVKADHPECFSTRGETKGQIKSSFKITEEMKRGYPEIFDIKGPIKKEFAIVDDMVAAAKKQELLMLMLEDARQNVLLTRMIDGIPVMSLLDVLTLDNSVIDIKTSRDIDEDSYDPRFGKKVPFYEQWDYWRQQAVYRFMADSDENSHLFVTSKPSKTCRVPKARMMTFADEFRFRCELAQFTATILAMTITTRENALKCGRCECCNAEVIQTGPIFALNYRQQDV
jgi:hypothetical protein